jgi:hypothetical protein
MAEATQFNFDFKEVATMLIKLQGIKDGKWVLGFEFSLGAGLLGLTPDNPVPGAFVTINKVVLSRYQEGTPEPKFLVDAAEVNT